MSDRDRVWYKVIKPISYKIGENRYHLRYGQTIEIYNSDLGERVVLIRNIDHGETLPLSNGEVMSLIKNNLARLPEVNQPLDKARSAAKKKIGINPRYKQQ